MQETWVWSLGWEDPLEEEMVTHPSILAWTISWTEEPGGLQSIGLQRVRYNWSDLACMHMQERRQSLDRAEQFQKRDQSCLALFIVLNIVGSVPQISVSCSSPAPSGCHSRSPDAACVLPSKALGVHYCFHIVQRMEPPGTIHAQLKQKAAIEVRSQCRHSSLR